jgi:hypothetical protein
MLRSLPVLMPLLLAIGPRVLHSQEHYTLGPVNRVILVDIKPGKARDFWTDLRQNLRPLYDEYKRQGLIQNYSVGVKSTTEGPQDWDAVIILTFKNYAALDTFATKGDSVSMRYFGSYDKRSESGIKRSEAATTVGSYLVRDVTLKDMPRQ